MFHSRSALCVALWLLSALSSVSQCQEPQLLPHAGVLVLRNGRVLRGNILYEGDRYVIGLGAEDQVSVPQASVVMRCSTLHEAYQRKRNALRPEATAAEHLELADWCLRYELTDAAAEQLLVAQRLAPNLPAAVRFEKRLRMAASRPETAPKTSMVASSFVSPEELDDFVRSMPVGTVERFTNTIQPLLINRCGAGSCHGPTSRNDFRLFFSLGGGILPRRITQRNLKTVHAYLDLQNPTASPLLVQATTAHGNSPNPPIHDASDVEQLDHLMQWIYMHVEGSKPPSPSVVDDPHKLLMQPVATVGSDRRGGADQTVSAAHPRGDRPDPLRNLVDPAVRPASHHVTEPAAGPAGNYQPVDPFDPEIFNRKFGHRR